MTQTRPGMAFQPGDVINNTYRIEALLGRGGTSDVYKARNEVSGRPMAMKVLKAEFSDNDDYLLLLKREEEIREVRHDAVVRYSENHRMEDGRVYLLMDFVDGAGLETKLREGPMPADELLTVAKRVAQGLQAAHSRNLVHRDLSPDNIILRNGDPAQAVIIDFGIAKDTNPGAETIVGNEFAGKYAYAAPEQLRGHTDQRTDLYSLGALLLANFRGAPPDIGNNPMEVVENKSKPLDTDGVPEPLKTLIDRLAAPNPDDRFASAAEVLDYLGAPEPFADVATIVPASAPSAVVEPISPPASDTPVAEPGSRKAPVLAGIAAVVVLAGAAGGYFSGAFGPPAHPEVDPFTFVATQLENEAPSVNGFVPSSEAQDAVTDLIGKLGGSAELKLASGDIGDTWGTDIVTALTALEPLDAWQLAADGNLVEIIGETRDPSIEASVESKFANGLPGVLDGVVDIALINVFLAESDVQAVLDEAADCGPLTQPNAPTTGYGPTESIVVSGRVTSTETRVRLFDQLRVLAGDRQVVLDLSVLNSTLCLIEAYLPNAPTGNVQFDYLLGSSMQPNPSGTFLVGENPVIDVVIPPEITDGYLTVSLLDVSGNVFHLLPNVMIEDNSVATLRQDRSGPVSVRVAFPDVPTRGPNQLAFRVDPKALGKSKLVAIHSTEPLFDGLRPMTESAAGFAEALKHHADADDNLIQTLDSRLLITQRP